METLADLSESAFDAAVRRFRPDVVVAVGLDAATGPLLGLARERQMATVVVLRGRARRAGPFAVADAVVVFSQRSADFHRAALGLNCVVLPEFVDLKRVRAERIEPTYLTFVDPTPESGVYPFARIADEVGKRRPDVPILVVEAQGTEANLVGCGLDLLKRGNVHLMAPTPDPRDYWGVTRVAVVPTLGDEAGASTILGAMVNGVPVVTADRGDFPNTSAGSVTILSLPDRFTAATRTLPTSEEVAPWVDAMASLWDGAAARPDCAERWDVEAVRQRHRRFFEELRPGQGVLGFGREDRSGWVALVPYLQSIEPECDEGLRALEREGVTVVRSRGSSAIDVVRSKLATEALHRGSEAILFIDADVGFDPVDALRLFAMREPVVAGVYPKKRVPELSSAFAPDVGEITFGPGAAGLYPLDYAAGGFLRIRCDVLRRMVDALDLPLCNAEWERGYWPLFLPMITPPATRGISAT